MDDDRLHQKTFDAFDEQDLAIVLTQVARRMLVLRAKTPDVGFWHSVLFKASKFLASSVELTDAEKAIVLENKGKHNLRAIRLMQSRTGMRLKACHKIISDWARDNVPKDI